MLELVATAFGLICVWLTVRQNIWCWPAGLVMVLLYIVIFFRVRLYSDMGLQVVYVVLQLYGWHHWLHGGAGRGRPDVGRISSSSALLWSAVAVGGTAGWGFLMARYTDAALPYWDAATTVMSLIAQWLMARKVLESWLVWISVDFLCVGIYLAKGLYLTAGLYTVFLGLAAMGFLEWKKTLPALQPA